MKKFLIPLFVLLLAWSCSPSQKAISSEKSPTISTDSTEYKIIILDPEFNTWYLINFSQAKDYSNQYYRSKNQLGASNWNDYFIRNRYNHIIEGSINYDNSIDYGIGVNRELYWYFTYIEDKFKVRLLH